MVSETISWKMVSTSPKVLSTWAEICSRHCSIAGGPEEFLLAPREMARPVEITHFLSTSTTPPPAALATYAM
ncbi:hypothetical protein GMLC_26270 [Geomonas limicola]|uniref:Uncharacterized protein n=1 Tax=Geomonas limicola TaxID=2740186 RepID=A0A6V8N902_9BACT|nr:hypothetical protein GMLC_26270 [Geomonas limicola]